MAWIFLEGLDRTGKSSVADLYKSKGYELVHMSAPDKKYREEGYSGPSYFEDLAEFYMKYDGKDVVFDRSIYGELVWPRIYQRDSQLAVDDLEYLREIEMKNDPIYYLMHDKDLKAHWQRCVDNKEPLTQKQFTAARGLFEQMLVPYGFRKVQLTDFPDARQPGEVDTSAIDDAVDSQDGADETKDNNSGVQGHTDDSEKRPTDSSSVVDKSKRSGQEILEMANAINTVLSNKIIKRKGTIYEQLEDEIREFLDKKLLALFGKDKPVDFDDTDYLILKRYCETVKKKMEAKS